MIHDITIRIFGGLGIAALVTFIALTIVVQQSIDVPVADVRMNLLGSMITGAFFSVASLLFYIESWSALKQTVVHFSVSLVVLFPVFTFLTGWVPLEPQALLIGLGIFTGSYVLNWIIFYMYFKRLEQQMNASIGKGTRFGQ